MGVIKDVEICRIGTWKGVPIDLARLQRWVDKNNSKEFSSVIAHPSVNKKIIGKNIIGSMKIVGDRLIQSVKDVPDWFREGVKEGHFPSRSVKFHPSTDELIHTGWLPDGVAPAVDGLAPVQLSVQFSELEEFEDDSEDSQYIEFSTIKDYFIAGSIIDIHDKKIALEKEKELAELKAQFVQFQADSKAKTEALEIELAKIKANVAEKPTEFSALVDQMVSDNKIFEWQKPFLNKLDPFKPIEFSSDSDRTALISDLKALSASWEIPVEFMATKKGEDMYGDPEDEEMKKAIKESSEKTSKRYMEK
jgi:hypothetical protein